MPIESNCLKGTIGEFSLADVIQLISLGGKSGRLALHNGSSDGGSLYFELGYVVHAHTNGLDGESAARSLVAMDEGTFEFDPGKAPGERSVMLTGHELLMRTAQSADEDAYLEDGGQLVLEIEDSADTDFARIKGKVKDILLVSLGRRSRQPLAALEASQGSLEDLLVSCERIERYIALFIDEALAEETGRKMREALGLA